MPMPETLPILYQDEQLVAVHKPSGLLVHRSMLDRHETRFAVQIVRNQTGRHVYPAHRLDRGTSGVLLFAYSRDVARALEAQFAGQQVAKTYLAVVRGHPPQEGVIDHPLTRQYDDYEFRTAAPAGDSQQAVTHYRCLARCELPYAVDRYPSSRYALVGLYPESGRRHQLRRHLKHIAHPIIGDATYGKGKHNRLFQTLFGNQRLLLACRKMLLRHPLDGRQLSLNAPLADDFSAVLAALGWSAAANDA